MYQLINNIIAIFIGLIVLIFSVFILVKGKKKIGSIMMICSIIFIIGITITTIFSYYKAINLSWNTYKTEFFKIKFLAEPKVEKKITIIDKENIEITCYEAFHKATNFSHSILMYTFSLSNYESELNLLMKPFIDNLRNNNIELNIIEQTEDYNKFSYWIKKSNKLYDGYFSFIKHHNYVFVLNTVGSNSNINKLNRIFEESFEIIK